MPVQPLPLKKDLPPNPYKMDFTSPHLKITQYIVADFALNKPTRLINNKKKTYFYFHFSLSLHLPFLYVDPKFRPVPCSFSVFSAFPGPVVWCMLLVLENSQPSLPQIFPLLLLSSPSHVAITCMSHLL